MQLILKSGYLYLVVVLIDIHLKSGGNESPNIDVMLLNYGSIFFLASW